MFFENREQAGAQLALKLRKIINPTTVSGQGDFVVVALLRGGVVLGKIVADYFKVPLKPLSVKKIGAPTNPELAIGAVTFDKTHYLDGDLIEHLDVGRDYIKNSLENKRKEAETLQKKFKEGPSLKNKRVIIIDDGVATGTTVICAVKYVKSSQAKETVLATPLIAKDSLRSIKRYFDSIISLKIVNNLTSVSQFYKYFPQVTDEETIEILNSK